MTGRADFNLCFIFYSPILGSFTMFKTLPDKMMVLDNARGELIKRDKVFQETIIMKEAIKVNPCNQVICANP